jgi:amino acid permease
MTNVLLFIKIYFVIMIVIILFAMYYYYNRQIIYANEMKKIEELEKEYEHIEKLKKETKECKITNLTDPRSCFVNSNYNCSWNKVINRCDELKYL